jgi:hypothetical protein
MVRIACLAVGAFAFVSPVQAQDTRAQSMPWSPDTRRRTAFPQRWCIA